MKVTDRDKKFRCGLMMGLRIAYIHVYGHSKKVALEMIQEHHDEYADIDKNPHIFDIPGMGPYAPREQANKGRSKKRS